MLVVDIAGYLFLETEMNHNKTMPNAWTRIAITANIIIFIPNPI